jgi:probable HAF family extracellular repeat protein
MARHTLPLLLLLPVASVAVGALACSDTRIPTRTVPPSPRPPPPPSSFPVRPAVDTVSLGAEVQFFAETRDSTVDQWVMSDTSLARLGPYYGSYAHVVTRAPGTVTVIARRGADSGVATLVIQAPPPAPASWDVIDLGIMDAISGRPVAINDKGTIVGTLRYNHNPSERPEERGFVYNDGMMRYLAGRDSLPLAIGPSGAIVGTDLTGIVGQFLIWEPGAEPRPLTNGTYKAAWGGRIIGANARGDILASIGEDGPESSSALYRTGRLWRNDSPVDLGQLNPSVPMRTLPTAWNTRGQVVGWSPVAEIRRLGDNGYPSHPFLWENGVMRDLGILGSSPCGEPVECGGGIATAINIHGTVVGQSSTKGSQIRAFIWQNGEMRDLGPFPGQNTNALAINDRGQVLGTVDQGPTFLWTNGETQIVPIDRVLLGPNGGYLGNQDLLLGPNGQVVGTRGGHVIIWEDGQETDLGEGSPIAMNNRGEIIGTRGALPTLWRKRG